MDSLDYLLSNIGLTSIIVVIITIFWLSLPIWSYPIAILWNLSEPKPRSGPLKYYIIYRKTIPLPTPIVLHPAVASLILMTFFPAFGLFFCARLKFEIALILVIIPYLVNLVLNKYIEVKDVSTDDGWIVVRVSSFKYHRVGIVTFGGHVEVDAWRVHTFLRDEELAERLADVLPGRGELLACEGLLSSYHEVFVRPRGDEIRIKPSPGAHTIVLVSRGFVLTRKPERVRELRARAVLAVAGLMEGKVSVPKRWIKAFVLGSRGRLAGIEVKSLAYLGFEAIDGIPPIVGPSTSGLIVLSIDAWDEVCEKLGVGWELEVDIKTVLLILTISYFVAVGACIVRTLRGGREPKELHYARMWEELEGDSNGVGEATIADTRKEEDSEEDVEYDEPGKWIRKHRRFKSLPDYYEIAGIRRRNGERSRTS